MMIRAIHQRDAGGLMVESLAKCQSAEAGAQYQDVNALVLHRATVFISREANAMTKRPPLPRLRVTTAAEAALRAGHPWLFDESILEQSRSGNIGELAVVYDRRNRFLALGLLDPLSPIRLRVLSTDGPQTVDDDWWRARLEKSLERRRGLFDDQTTGYRCIHGESDGWPGLVLDRYDKTIVLKLYTGAWLSWLDSIIKVFVELLKPQRLILRLSRNIQDFSAEKFGMNDGETLTGSASEEAAVFLENGLKFEADIVRGQKTGFFLDQRENRKQVGELAQGRRLLNVFSFSGGFSLYAAHGGARSATDLDISAHALAAARRNFSLNLGDPDVAKCSHVQEQADAFQWLARPGRKEKFDLIVLDPPSMARRESERAEALKAYRKLGSLGIERLAPGGVLVACSCSAHVSELEFFTAVEAAASASRRRFESFLRTGQPADHPATFAEGRYLKGIYLRFGR
jgi:23S rRNA (cytosine1962-C5)-methyltransferase